MAGAEVFTRTAHRDHFQAASDDVDRRLDAPSHASLEYEGGATSQLWQV